MPQITVWCLPPDLTEEKLRELHKKIVAAAVNITKLGLNGEQDILALFPPDMMKYGAGTEIMVQVSELWDKPSRTREVRQRLARALGETVAEMFSDAIVTVRLDPPFNPTRDGFWTSRASPRMEPKNPLLNMDPQNFFSMERLLGLGISHHIAMRVRNGMLNDRVYHTGISPTNMQEFIDRYPMRGTLKRIPGVGNLSADAIVLAMKDVGLHFQE